MKFAKSILMGTGSVVLAGLILTLLVPKAAHALAATAVQVMNTIANPVPTMKVDDPGRIPYQADLYVGLANNDCTDGCQIPGPLVLAGKRLVITNISGLVRENLPGGSLVLAHIRGNPNGNVFAAVTYQGNFAGLNYFVFSQPTQVVYNQGTVPVFFIHLSAVATSADVEVTLTGYMLDCSTGPCAAIAP